MFFFYTLHKHIPFAPPRKNSKKKHYPLLRAPTTPRTGSCLSPTFFNWPRPPTPLHLCPILSRRTHGRKRNVDTDEMLPGNTLWPRSHSLCFAAPTFNRRSPFFSSLRCTFFLTSLFLGMPSWHGPGRGTLFFFDQKATGDACRFFAPAPPGLCLPDAD